MTKIHWKSRSSPLAKRLIASTGNSQRIRINCCFFRLWDYSILYRTQYRLHSGCFTLTTTSSPPLPLSTDSYYLLSSSVRRLLVPCVYLSALLMSCLAGSLSALGQRQLGAPYHKPHAHGRRRVSISRCSYYIQAFFKVYTSVSTNRASRDYICHNGR